MSNRQLPLSLLLLGLLLPRTLPAQAARLTARMDSLATLWREADAVADLVDSLTHRPAPIRIDTLRAGSLLVLSTNPPFHLREATDSAWKVFDAFYGSAAANLAAYPIRIVGLDSGQRATRAQSIWGYEVARDLDVERLSSFLITSPPIGDLDPAFRQWLGGVVRPVIDTAARLGDVYTALVTSPYSAAHDCFRGSLAGCRATLSLDEGTGTVQHRYPTPEDRRLLIALVGAAVEDAGGKLDVRACQAGRDSSCQAVLRSLPPARLRLPILPTVHLSLTQFAVRAGGREAYQRLLASNGQPIAERLALTAALPFDTLLDHWRRRVIHDRPAPVAVPFGVVGAGLSWILLFGLCGARSSRWRVG